MGKIGIITLLVLCLILLLLTGCMINTVTPEIDNGNFGNQEDINQSNNSSQNSSTGSVEEPVIADTEEPVEEPGTVYPQKWTTGDGTAANPWANDCINKAITNCPAGGTIFLKAGYYSSPLININKSLNLIGEGMDKTIIVTSMTKTNGIYIETDYCTLEGFTIDGTSQTGGVASLINIHNSDYLSLKDLEVMNAGYYGINVFQVNHSLFQNIHSHDNYRHGIHPGSEKAGRNNYNTFQDIYAWDNGADGIDSYGWDATENSNNVYDNIHCWDNGENGINITGQSGVVLSNSTASGNGKNGINLHTLNNSSISNCSSILNKERGIYLINSNNINFTDVIIKSSTNNGIVLDNSNNIVFTSCESYDDRTTLIQRYGLELKENCSGITVLNCKLMPNKVGDIDNPYNVAIVVITEKMLAKF